MSFTITFRKSARQSTAVSASLRSPQADRDFPIEIGLECVGFDPTVGLSLMRILTPQREMKHEIFAPSLVGLSDSVGTDFIRVGLCLDFVDFDTDGTGGGVGLGEDNAVVGNASMSVHLQWDLHIKTSYLTASMPISTSAFAPSGRHRVLRLRHRYPSPTSHGEWISSQGETLGEIRNVYMQDKEITHQSHHSHHYLKSILMFLRVGFLVGIGIGVESGSALESGAGIFVQEVGCAHGWKLSYALR